MKIIFVGLFVTFLTCQAEVDISNPIQAIKWPGGCFDKSNQKDTPEVSKDKVSVQLILNRTEDCKNPLTEQLDKLQQKVKEFEEKFEELSKTVTAIKARQVSQFEKIGSKYYYIDDTHKVSWIEAAHRCRSMGGNLAGLQSAAELKAVSEKLTHNHYWLEINDLAEEGVFQLLSSGRRANFLQWHSGEPNNENVENCVVLVKLGTTYAMNDSQCEIKLNYICDMDTLE